MGKTYTADLTLNITVKFEDDGEGDLVSQAWDAAWDHDFSYFNTDGEVHKHSIKEVPA